MRTIKPLPSNLKAKQQALRTMGFLGKNGKKLKLDGDNGIQTNYALTCYATEVKQAQTRLLAHGIKGLNGKALSVDGAYGANTIYAVKYFQKLKGLVPTGIVDAGTWSKLMPSSKPKTNSVPSSPHFRITEFKCNDGTLVPSKYYPNVQKVMNMLEKLRSALGSDMIKINSGYRTAGYNAKVGGAKSSLHLTANAADIVAYKNGKKIAPATVYAKANTIVGNAGGVGKYSTFTHIDCRGTKSRW